MSSGDAFHQRGEALENQFFAKVDEELVKKLREKQEVQDLQKMLGVCDSTAKSLHALGVSTETSAALRLAPLVAVAWADGLLESKERDAVLQAAALHGITQDQPSGKLLAVWLQSPPPRDCLEFWCEYAATLVSNMTPEAAQSLKESIVNDLKKVASATGGVLGWGAVSDGESAILRRVEAALTRKN